MFRGQLDHGRLLYVSTCLWRSQPWFFASLAPKRPIFVVIHQVRLFAMTIGGEFAWLHKNLSFVSRQT